MYLIKIFDINRSKLDEFTPNTTSLATAIRAARRATKKNVFAFFYCLYEGKNILVKECPARNWIEFQTDRYF